MPWNPDEPIDIVYTWVDDKFPGYAELLGKWANRPHDADPERTRDNLHLLKYSLRSLQRNLPWVRTLYLVTCRPQVPAWLDLEAPGLQIVHHDEFFDPADLPTFNSLAILANLHKIRGLSQRFIWNCDDILFCRAVHKTDFVTDDGKIIVYTQVDPSPNARRRDAANETGWNLSLANSNHVLDQRYGKRTRPQIKHIPHFIDTRSWQQMIDTWPEEFRHTSASKFRAHGNIAPEHLYPYFLTYEGLGVKAPFRASYSRAGYAALNDWLVLQWLQIAYLQWLQPTFCCLNDSLGPRPNPRVERYIQRFLDSSFPEPSRWERTGGEQARVIAS